MRAALIAACYAAGPDEWQAAVTALGAASRAGFPAPKPRPLGTYKSFYQTIWLITRSHHFSEAERTLYRERAQYDGASEVLYLDVTTTAATRAKAERAAQKATTQAARP